MAHLPPISPDLVRHLEGVRLDLSLAAMRALAALPGNPLGVEVQIWGQAMAYAARHATGESWWNRALGLDAVSDRELAEIVAFFAGRVGRWHTDTAPGLFTESLGRRLAAHGLVPAQFSTILYGLAEPRTPVTVAGLRIRPSEPAELDLVTELWADGFELPPGPDRERIRAIRAGWFTVPENRCYIAEIDGRPVAMAALYLHGSVGFLNVGATLPAYRRRGCHAALTQQRIADAAAAGCTLVIGHTGFGGQSQSNEERLGLRVAYTPMTWAAIVTDGAAQGQSGQPSNDPGAVQHSHRSRAPRAPRAIRHTG